MEGMILKPDLRVPEQKTASLSFCDTTPKAFRGWISQLPMANIGEVSRQLYHAVIELNHLFIAPQQRIQFLELIREKIHFVCNELSRHYLGMAVALPEKQRKIANLSQALQLHLASGYKLCVLEFLDSGSIDRNRKQVAMAVHRAISELAATIVRSHQLYCPSPAQSWLECHRLFRFGYRNKLASIEIDDDTLLHRRSSTVADAYKRILLLGCARPNQLRQSELLQVYELCEIWSDHTRCGPDIGQDSLFVINMERDNPPIYRSLLDHQPGEDSFDFDTRDLSAMVLDTLHARRNQGKGGGALGKGDSNLQVPAKVSDTLLTHLSQALGILAKRNFNRIASQGTLEVCVGLTAAHYFVAGEKTFTEFVNGNDTGHQDEENLFVRNARRNQDAWAGAHDAGPSEDAFLSSDTPINFRGNHGTASKQFADKNRPRSHHALLINTSPGGYCVAWESNVPASLQAGEILGVREQSSHPWSLAIVRWIRQIKNQGTQVGIELLAPSAAPCGVRLIQKMGHSSEYLRGLLLPEISVVNQSATLITPRLPFQSGSRISLLHDGREDQGQLSKKVSSTGSISQFELKLQNATALQPSTVATSAGASEDEFDSLWPSL
ncbi:GTPase [Marinobacter sp. M216]|uniref:GTPase n=1 Tax=Marinobacter albus TaxID=3030833 RepID=A0ABT7H9V7_9GAMM|nr:MULTISPECIES: GTPase [unclassified Marinobacter]MBW7470601.1 GTPase [Marinobacter sp. F4218]MDK9557131.1 GTPase [Marinobacter sp. M216]